MAECHHFALLSEQSLNTHLEGQPRSCPECVAAGDTWVHLRTCASCSHVGCCESSKNKHALRHFKSTQHPVIQLAEQPDTLYCYLDDAYARIAPSRHRRPA